MRKQRTFSSRRRGFTLIEIMVAAVITVIMVGLVIQITGEVLKLWNRSMGRMSANEEARIAMELLTSDLEAAVLINNGQQWLRVEAESNVGVPTAGQTVALKLFTSALDRPDEQGNVSAVAYVLAYAPAYDGALSPSFVLFRNLAGSVETFEDLLGPGPGDPQLSLEDGFWDPAQITNTSNYLAGNIVDFKVFIYGVDDSGDKVVWNDTNEDGIIDEDFIYGGTDSDDQLPSFAEIKLTIVSDQGLEILSLPTLSGTGFDNVQQVIRQHGEVFKRRVHFQAKPL